MFIIYLTYKSTESRKCLVFAFYTLCGSYYRYEGSIFIFHFHFQYQETFIWILFLKPSNYWQKLRIFYLLIVSYIKQMYLCFWSQFALVQQ